MSNVYSFVISGHVNSVTPQGNVYVVSMNHIDKYNNFSFNVLTSPGMIPPVVGSNVILSNAIPVNSVKQGNEYVHNPHLRCTNRSSFFTTDANTTINELIVSGRLAKNGTTDSGVRRNGKSYTYSKFLLISNYWNGQAEESFSLQTTYWRAALKGLVEGNGAMVEGRLEFNQNPNNGLGYFNLTAYNFDYGSQSSKNLGLGNNNATQAMPNAPAMPVAPAVAPVPQPAAAPVPQPAAETTVATPDTATDSGEEAALQAIPF